MQMMRGTIHRQLMNDIVNLTPAVPDTVGNATHHGTKVFLPGRIGSETVKAKHDVDRFSGRV